MRVKGVREEEEMVNGSYKHAVRERGGTLAFGDVKNKK